MRAIIRDEEWMIKKVEVNSLGNNTLYVSGLTPLVKNVQASFLADVEGRIDVIDPKRTRLVQDQSPFFNRSRLFVESQWRQKVPTHTDLCIGDQAAMNLLEYQLEPTQLALRQPRQRILIADAVGLGKTLEAGIFLSELIARGKGKRILVVTVKSMMTQFQKEMWNRFTIPLVRLDSHRISRITHQIPSNHNPFYYYDRTIISMDTLKRDVQYRKHLESAWWDIIVIDEAHNVAVRGKRAQRARLAQLLSERSDTLIMLSATPHDGRSESFASLMNMLDPTAIADPGNYTKEDIKGLAIRRFKKDIQNQARGAFQQRRISIETCQATPPEEEAFGVFVNMQLEGDAKGRGATHLFKTTLEKSMFSSPAACIKSINERIRRQEKKDGLNSRHDIQALLELRTALERIEPQSFSRYAGLVDLIKSPAYAWKPEESDDRIVIFTERIETMRFLADNLKEDLQLPPGAIEVMHGSMSDMEQQRIVEEFGRTDSPIRILVASDVASEGINLHYLCHRLVHFDIPWSLMVFQQRNGRIDRYGQTKQPDIRYMMIQSENEKIKGDTRILEILVEKEEQATKNIGDPAVLMGVWDPIEEEQITAAAIESDLSAAEFAERLSVEEAQLDPLELLMMGATEGEEPVKLQRPATLFSDLEYLSKTLDYLGQRERHRFEEMRSVQGLQIELSTELKGRLEGLIPEEAFPADDILRLSTDKDYCMEEMRRSLQHDLMESAWPATQYLWPLHPIFEWVRDRTSILYGRQEAPILGLSTNLEEDECIFIMAGTIPNRKSTPVVDEWFALRYKGNRFQGEMSMDQLIEETMLNHSKIPNTNAVNDIQVEETGKLLATAVDQAQKVMEKHYQEYNARVNPQIRDELNKLAELQDRHHTFINTSLEDQKRRREQEMRKVDKIFDDFVEWVTDTLEIEKDPYVRVIAVLTGVSK